MSRTTGGRDQEPAGGPTDGALLEAARAAAGEAADVHRESADPEASRWGEKGRSDFVTEVDREAERRIVRTLRDRFPDHRIVAEEATAEPDGGGRAAAPPDASVAWIVDPLDGTTNWLHGYPEYSVSVAALDPAGLRVGVVLNTATGERFEAVRDGGSRRNGEEIHVSGIEDPSRALLGTGFPFKHEDLLSAYLPTLGRAILGTAGVRRGGSAALDLCDLACGRLDGFWELWLQPWDVAAGILIVWEAGGEFDALDAPGGAPGRLRETAEGARAFLAACRGRAPLGAAPRPGSYVGTNGLLASPVRDLVLRER